jgi:hypothetical protein
MSKSNGETLSDTGRVEQEIDQLTEKGFSQKEIFTLFYQRARWRTKLTDECAGEPTQPRADTAN